jgi:hypothetical protein
MPAGGTARKQKGALGAPRNGHKGQKVLKNQAFFR